MYSPLAIFSDGIDNALASNVAHYLTSPVLAFLFNHEAVQLVSINMCLVAQCAGNGVDCVESIHYEAPFACVWADSRAFVLACTIESFNSPWLFDNHFL